MNAREAMLALLAARAEDATVCPSEVARTVAGPAGEWREAMPEVHAAVDQMVSDGLVRLSWKGGRLSVRAGPYRIGRGGG
ncbi:DUF3253 domain-containing protein [Brevundimonas intermedia]|uniref:DUF3253 domain-containing protein n=2 Tax=Brevundimonas intermedia TaxID=74315 RepID=A0A4Y9RVX8_9CAUL|nr:DUF3253 domain-containing protein [Brevundimonas intermedia]